jgi:hypothetical protein
MLIKEHDAPRAVKALRLSPGMTFSMSVDRKHCREKTQKLHYRCLEEEPEVYVLNRARKVCSSVPGEDYWNESDDSGCEHNGDYCCIPLLNIVGFSKWNYVCWGFTYILLILLVGNGYETMFFAPLRRPYIWCQFVD